MCGVFSGFRPLKTDIPLLYMYIQTFPGKLYTTTDQGVDWSQSLMSKFSLSKCNIFFFSLLSLAIREEKNLCDVMFFIT